MSDQPTVRPPASDCCACGRPLVAGVTDCRGCADGLFAAWAAVADRVDQLPVRERIAFWARAREHTRERTAARLARGP